MYAETGRRVRLADQCKMRPRPTGVATASSGSQVGSSYVRHALPGHRQQKVSKAATNGERPAATVAITGRPLIAHLAGVVHVSVRARS